MSLVDSDVGVTLICLGCIKDYLPIISRKQIAYELIDDDGGCSDNAAFNCFVIGSSGKVSELGRVLEKVESLGGNNSGKGESLPRYSSATRIKMTIMALIATMIFDGRVHVDLLWGAPWCLLVGLGTFFHVGSVLKL